VLLPLYALGFVALLGRVLGSPDEEERTSVRKVAPPGTLDSRG
jgi:hypothetical protein